MRAGIIRISEQEALLQTRYGVFSRLELRAVRTQRIEGGLVFDLHFHGDTFPHVAEGNDWPIFSLEEACRHGWFVYEGE